MEDPKEALYRHFEKIFPDRKEYADRFRPVLSCLAGAPEPIPLDLVRQITSRPEADCWTLIRRMGPLVNVWKDIFEHTTLALAKPALTAWLTSEAAGAYRADPAEAGARMAEYLVSFLRKGSSRLPSYEARCLPHYVTAYAPHLAPRGIEVLVSDSVYLTRLLDIGDEALKKEDKALAESCFRMALTYAAGWVHRDNTPSSRRVCVKALHRMGDIFQNADQADTALSLYEQSLELSKESAREGKTPETMNAARISAEKVGNASKKAGQHENAISYYELSIMFCDALAAENDAYDQELGRFLLETGVYIVLDLNEYQRGRPFILRSIEVFGKHKETLRWQKLALKTLRVMEFLFEGKD